jgi:small subunit ribosomal protein S26e
MFHDGQDKFCPVYTTLDIQMCFLGCEYRNTFSNQKKFQVSNTTFEHMMIEILSNKTVETVWSALPMPQKRRNGGRSKMNAGRKQTVNCLNCGRFVPRDKAIKRFTMKQIVDGSSQADVKGASIYTGEVELPKTYQKSFYCVSCAVHRRIVRVRSRIHRRDRLSVVQKKRLSRAEEKSNRNEARAAE